MNKPFPTLKSSTPAISRRQLARAEYNRAYTELWTELNAGRISRADARDQFAALLAAYRKTKEDLALVSFVSSHRLSHVFGMEG